MIICVQCHVYIPDESLVAHMRWHDEGRTADVSKEAELSIFHAHQENLIERMYRAEKQIEAALARIYFLEREVRGLPPTGDPLLHHHQTND